MAVNRLSGRRRLWTVAAVVSVVTATFALATDASAANADTVLSQQVYNTGGEGLWLHPDSPALDSATSDLMPDGTEFDITCFVTSDDVNGDAVWDFGTDAATGSSGYAADFYINTPVQQGQEADQLTGMGLPECGSQGDSTSSGDTAWTNTLVGVPYDREAAASWADANVSAPSTFRDDCTWFASQALWAGGLPQSHEWDGNSWDWSQISARSHYPGPTFDATLANNLVNYLVDNGLATRVPIDWSDNTASGAQPGDLIAYHWNNNETQIDPDSGELLVDHLTVVVRLNSQGYPTIAQHTPNHERYWSWDPGDPTTGHPAGWIQYVDTIDGGQQPSAWLIHINTGPTF